MSIFKLILGRHNYLEKVTYAYSNYILVRARKANKKYI